MWNLEPIQGCPKCWYVFLVFTPIHQIPFFNSIISVEFQHLVIHALRSFKKHLKKNVEICNQFCGAWIYNFLVSLACTQQVPFLSILLHLFQNLGKHGLVSTWKIIQNFETIFWVPNIWIVLCMGTHTTNFKFSNILPVNFQNLGKHCGSPLGTDKIKFEIWNHLRVPKMLILFVCTQDNHKFYLLWHPSKWFLEPYKTLVGSLSKISKRKCLNLEPNWGCLTLVIVYNSQYQQRKEKKR